MRQAGQQQGDGLNVFHQMVFIGQVRVVAIADPAGERQGGQEAKQDGYTRPGRLAGMSSVLINIILYLQH